VAHRPYGRFERARVLWAGGPPQPRLSQLAEQVRGELQALQIRFDSKPFAAHVTLLRDVPAGRSTGSSEVVEPIEPFIWPIHDARLLVSERDSDGATCYRASTRLRGRLRAAGTRLRKTLRRAGPEVEGRAARALQRIIPVALGLARDSTPGSLSELVSTVVFASWYKDPRS